MPFITKPYTVATNPNLLDNWYFADGITINQRGALTHSGTGYHIDRWKGGNNYGSCELTASGLAVTGANNWHPEVQVIENGAAILDGKTVTISALLSNGMLIKSTGKISLTGTARNLISVSTPTESGMIMLNGSTSGVSFMLRASVGKTVTFVAAKLELGDCQTLAHCVDNVSGLFEVNEIPNYQQELAKCQRYFTRLKNIAGNYNRIGIANAYSATIAMAIVPLPVTMKSVTPTVSYSQIHLQNGTTTIAATSITFRGLSVNAAYFDIGASGLSAGAMYLVKGDYGSPVTNDGYIDISCEL